MSLRSFFRFDMRNKRRRVRPGRIAPLLLAVLALLGGGRGSAVLSAPRAFAASAEPVTEDTLCRAIQQTAYSYYMRGPNIQYNSMKGNLVFFPPEEATGQSTSYTVCSAFVKNVYYDMLGIKLPPYTDSLLEYGRQNVGNPEVILYGETRDHQNNMRVYNEKTGRLVNYTDMTTDQLLSYLKTGDILVYTGHAMLVYDLIYAENGDLVDARVMESVHGEGDCSIRTKISRDTYVGGGSSFGNSNHLLYYNSRLNSLFDDGLLEGSIRLSTLKTVNVWKALDSNSKNQFSVLRFLSVMDGNLVLNYRGAEWSDRDHVFEITSLSDKTMDRLKYPRLYIEKTVDAYAGSTVEAGGELDYTIEIVNRSGADYADEITVTENISPYAEYETYTATKAVIFSREEESGPVCWNIGRLSSGERVVIRYRTALKKNAEGKTIESTGSVEHIPSATVRNSVQHPVPTGFPSALVSAYEELRDTDSGLSLIGRIYQQAAGTDLGLRELQLHTLVENTNLRSVQYGTVSLNEDHALYRAVLGRYWGAMTQRINTFHDAEFFAFDLKYWQDRADPDRRADTICEEHFRTGDVLIYSNTDDVVYRFSEVSGTAEMSSVTPENGVYAYLYIEGRGFVGPNCGADGLQGSADDRIDFSPDYYRENGLSLFSVSGVKDESLLRYANYQTLLGKDYYVVLRPSLLLFPAEEIEEETAQDVQEPDAADAALDQSDTDEAPAGSGVSVRTIGIAASVLFGSVLLVYVFASLRSIGENKKRR